MYRIILKSFIAGLVFFGAGLLVCFVTLAAWSGLNPSSGDILSVTKWNELVNKVSYVDSTSSVLNLTGTVKIQNHNFAKQITVCNKYDSVSSVVGHNAYLWTSSDCDNGLPTGACMSMLSRGAACGDDWDWQALGAGEFYNGTTFINGGVSWWMGSSVCGGRWLRVIYFCY